LNRFDGSVGRARLDERALARPARTSQVAGVNAPPDSPVSDAPHPLQIKAWREMGSSGRSELAAELRRKARRWKREALRTQHPAWTEQRINRELADIYLRGHT
jgi:hypothetical protein